MATESTTAIVTLLKGPLTYRVKEYSFRQLSPIQIPINARNAELLEQLRGDANFEVKMPSKKADPKKAEAKGKKASSPPPPVDESEEDETEEEGDEDEDESEEQEEETEEKAAGHARAELKDLSKADLLKIAKKLKVKGVSKQLSRSAIIDAIMEAQGGE
jgi:uncharacterized Zn ribbon protein